MAISLSSSPILQYSNPGVQLKCVWKSTRSARHSRVSINCCELKGSPPPAAEEGSGFDRNSGLKIGSPVVVVEAPRMIKTAASVPCLRVNSGLVKPGDVGRIVSRKPKDVWAVRLTIGTYLIDGKYFKPLELDE